MKGLFEINLGERLPSCKLSENIVDAREWILFRLQLLIYGDLVVASYSPGTIWFNHWHNKCCPATEFDLVQYSLSFQAFQLYIHFRFHGV